MSSNVSLGNIHRYSLNQNFYIGCNDAAQDPYLSYAAKGILSHLLSLPSTWIIKTSYFSNLYQGDRKGNGKEGVSAMIKELIQHGYMTYEKTRKPDGTWEHSYQAYPCKVDKFQKMFPQPVQPTLVQKTQKTAPTQRFEPEPVNPTLVNPAIIEMTDREKTYSSSSSLPPPKILEFTGGSLRSEEEEQKQKEQGTRTSQKQQDTPREKVTGSTKLEATPSQNPTLTPPPHPKTPPPSKESPKKQGTQTSQLKSQETPKKNPNLSTPLKAPSLTSPASKVNDPPKRTETPLPDVDPLEGTNLSPQQKQRLKSTFNAAQLDYAVKIASTMKVKKDYISLLLYILNNPNKFEESTSTPSNLKAVQYNHLLSKLKPSISQENSNTIPQGFMKIFLPNLGLQQVSLNSGYYFEKEIDDAITYIHTLM